MSHRGEKCRRRVLRPMSRGPWSRKAASAHRAPCLPRRSCWTGGL